VCNPCGCIIRFSNTHFVDEEGSQDLVGKSQVLLLRRRSSASTPAVAGGGIGGFQHQYGSPLAYQSYWSPSVDHGSGSGAALSSATAVARYNVILSSTAGGRVELLVSAGRRNVLEAVIVFLLCSCLREGEGGEGWPSGVSEAMHDILLHIFDCRGPGELMAVLSRLVSL